MRSAKLVHQSGDRVLGDLFEEATWVLDFTFGYTQFCFQIPNDSVYGQPNPASFRRWDQLANFVFVQLQPFLLQPRDEIQRLDQYRISC